MLLNLFSFGRRVINHLKCGHLSMLLILMVCRCWSLFTFQHHKWVSVVERRLFLGHQNVSTNHGLPQTWALWASLIFVFVFNVTRLDLAWTPILLSISWCFEHCYSSSQIIILLWQCVYAANSINLSTNSSTVIFSFKTMSVISASYGHVRLDLHLQPFTYFIFITVTDGSMWDFKTATTIIHCSTV